VAIVTTAVLICGAGPVGLTMAAELTRYGVPVRIVDKAAARTDKSKALVVWSRSLELIERMGCADAFVASGTKVVAANIIGSGGPVARITLDGIRSPYAYGLMIAQSDTERLLEEHLERLGVRVERQVELVSFESRASSVASVLRHADGRDETQESAWLIGCDGAHSAVRHGLGLEFHGEALPSDWILADVHLDGMRIPTSEIVTYWHAEGVLAMFPMGGTHYRVIAEFGLADPDTRRRADPTLAEIQEVVERRGPGGLTVRDPVWLASFRINERKVESYRAGRVFLAGDAAHIHSPAGGQGMNTGMQDAFNLSWKLALVCHGVVAADPLLDSYSVERSAVGDQVLANAGRLTRMATLKNPIVQHLRNGIAGLVFGLAPVRRKMADTLTELSIGYPDSPLSRKASGAPHGDGIPEAGERAPVPAPSGGPFGAGPSPRFAVMASDTAAAAALAARFPRLVEPTARVPFDRAGIWLVRPDGYVGVAAGTDGWSAIGDYLSALAPAIRA